MKFKLVEYPYGREMGFKQDIVWFIQGTDDNRTWNFYRCGKVSPAIVFEKELGYPVCHCGCHHINRDIIEEMECCRQSDEKYLFNVGGRTYILIIYADKLLGDNAEIFC